MIVVRMETFSVRSVMSSVTPDTVSVVAGANTDDCSESGDILGAVCDVKCDPGYSLNGAATMTCAVAAGADPEAAPTFSTPGTCTKKSCGETPTDVDPNIELGAKSNGFKGVLGDTIAAKCKEGYKASGDGKAELIC